MATQRGNRGALVRVALVGYTNVGKSTLTNALLGEKVSIVTPKAQTTSVHGKRGSIDDLQGANELDIVAAVEFKDATSVEIV